MTIGTVILLYVIGALVVGIISAKVLNNSEEVYEPYVIYFIMTIWPFFIMSFIFALIKGLLNGDLDK